LKILTIVYIVNSTLLLLHEIESAYEKEWEILKLPGKITGFLILHIPIILLIFYGLLEIDKLSKIGLIIGTALGAGGIIPFFVHKVFVKRNEHFNLFISDAVIYLNLFFGALLVYLSIRHFS